MIQHQLHKKVLLDFEGEKKSLGEGVCNQKCEAQNSLPQDTQIKLPIVEFSQQA